MPRTDGTTTEPSVGKLGESAYWLGALCLMAWVASFAFRYPTALEIQDIWRHTASAKALAASPWSPPNPLYPTQDPSPRMTPYTMLLVLFWRLSPLPVWGAMAIASLFNVALIALGVHVVCTWCFGDRGLRLYLLAVLIFFWGKGWTYAGIYQISALPYNVSYPATFGLGAAMVGFGLATRFVQKGGVGLYAGLNVLLSIVLISHPYAGVWAVGVIPLIAIFCEGASRRRILLFLTPVWVLAAAICWPYFSFLRYLSAAGHPWALPYSPGAISGG